MTVTGKYLREFDSLEFQAHPSGDEGILGVKLYDNGYGVAVSRGPWTKNFKYELCVVRHNDRGLRRDFSQILLDKDGSPVRITNVLDDLSPADANHWMEQVKCIRGPAEPVH